jgi:hypothetical protein
VTICLFRLIVRILSLLLKSAASRMSFVGILLTSVGLFVAPSPAPDTTRAEAVTYFFEPPGTPAPSPDADSAADVLEDRRERDADMRYKTVRQLRSRRVMREVTMHASFIESFPLRLKSLMTPHDVRDFMREIVVRTESLLAVLKPIGSLESYDTSESYDYVDDPFSNDKALMAAASTASYEPT